MKGGAKIADEETKDSYVQIGCISYVGYSKVKHVDPAHLMS